ncbi:MAG: hypothetical protein ACLF0G_17095, partial [Candidatus Brocadiia bacterium]
MAWYSLGPTIAASQPLEALRAAFAASDLVALDLDHCIFPGYSQTALGERVAWRLLARPARFLDRRFLPRLGLGGLCFALKEARRLLGRETSMERLMARYERAMRGIPEPYVLDAAKAIPPASYPLAEATIAELCRLAPTGIVTLGLDVVARAYMEAFAGLSFYEANRVVFRTAARRDRVFGGYDRASLMLDGGDKRRALERRMGDLGATTPTTVGHSEDDVPLASLARERGGLGIGFNPPASLRESFDVVVHGLDWEPMYALVAILAAPRAARPPPGAGPAGKG